MHRKTKSTYVIVLVTVTVGPSTAFVTVASTVAVFVVVIVWPSVAVMVADTI